MGGDAVCFQRDSAAQPCENNGVAVLTFVLEDLLKPKRFRVPDAKRKKEAMARALDGASRIRNEMIESLDIIFVGTEEKVLKKELRMLKSEARRTVLFLASDFALTQLRKKQPKPTRRTTLQPLLDGGSVTAYFGCWLGVGSG
jgi:hypothetical protein